MNKYRIEAQVLEHQEIVTCLTNQTLRHSSFIITLDKHHILLHSCDIRGGSLAKLCGRGLSKTIFDSFAFNLKNKTNVKQMSII